MARYSALPGEVLFSPESVRHSLPMPVERAEQVLAAMDRQNAEAREVADELRQARRDARAQSPRVLQSEAA